MTRTGSPPMRRAKMRCARLRPSGAERTGLADGADMGFSFGETGSIAHVLEFGKDLSKKLGIGGQNPLISKIGGPLWADSAPSVVASGRTGVRAIAVVPS